MKKATFLRVERDRGDNLGCARLLAHHQAMREGSAIALAFHLVLDPPGQITGGGKYRMERTDALGLHRLCPNAQDLGQDLAAKNPSIVHGDIGRRIGVPSHGLDDQAGQGVFPLNDRHEVSPKEMN